MAVLAVLFGVIILVSAVSRGTNDDATSLQLVANVASIPLGWAYFRWFINHTELAGRSLRFDGSVWAYVGRTLLIYVSVLTVIGWGWAVAAFYRWMARHVHGTDGQVRFVGKGHQVLWRTIVYVLFCLPIATIPWAARWFTRWLVQQFELDLRTSVSMR